LFIQKSPDYVDDPEGMMLDVLNFTRRLASPLRSCEDCAGTSLPPARKTPNFSQFCGRLLHRRNKIKKRL